MRPLRLTIRRTMALVAILAVLLGSAVNLRYLARAAHYRNRAEGYARDRDRYRAWAREARRNAEELTAKAQKYSGRLQFLREQLEDGARNHRRFAERFDQVADHYEQVERIYRQAAERPRATLPPIPPRPVLPAESASIQEQDDDRE